MPDGISTTLNPFYRQVLDILDASGIPYLLGGAFALFQYTGLQRDTKDLDLFIMPHDCERALEAARRAGYASSVHAPHWLAKIVHEGAVVDLIYSSGNGLARVDAGWFEHAPESDLGGRRVRLVPPEEMIWSKSFIMERHRYDGADVAHLLRHCGRGMDWERLLARFDEHWPVLLSHLVLALYIYPAERNAIPAWVLERLLQRTLETPRETLSDVHVCRGTFLSNFQYEQDLGPEGYRDARLTPHGPLTMDDLALWNAHLRSELPPLPGA